MNIPPSLSASSSIDSTTHQLASHATITQQPRDDQLPRIETIHKSTNHAIKTNDCDHNDLTNNILYATTADVIRSDLTTSVCCNDQICTNLACYNTDRICDDQNADHHYTPTEFDDRSQNNHLDATENNLAPTTGDHENDHQLINQWGFDTVANASFDRTSIISIETAGTPPQTTFTTNATDLDPDQRVSDSSSLRAERSKKPKAVVRKFQQLDQSQLISTPAPDVKIGQRIAFKEYYGSEFGTIRWIGELISDMLLTVVSPRQIVSRFSLIA